MLNFSSGKGLFTSPQSIDLDVVDSSTIKRSLGLLPVRLPVIISKAPVSVRVPSFKLNDFSINSLDVKLL